MSFHRERKITSQLETTTLSPRSPCDTLFATEGRLFNTARFTSDRGAVSFANHGRFCLFLVVPLRRLRRWRRAASPGRLLSIRYGLLLRAAPHRFVLFAKTATSHLNICPSLNVRDTVTRVILSDNRVFPNRFFCFFLILDSEKERRAEFATSLFTRWCRSWKKKSLS